MPAYKNKDNGTWYVMTQYTNWKGERKPKCKRGFDTKREAQEWEHTFRQQNSGDLDMPFSAFVEIYCREQKPRLKESTWQTKENIIQQKILPYFENYKINEITNSFSVGAAIISSSTARSCSGVFGICRSKKSTSTVTLLSNSVSE